METTIEVVALVAAVLFYCLAVLRRSTTPAVQLVTDPAVAHHLLNEDAGTLTDRPSHGLLTALATWTRGPRRVDTITTAFYGSLWLSLRSNLTAGFLTRSSLAAFAPLQREAVQDLVTGMPADGEVVMREHLDRAMFALAARRCFGDGLDESCVSAMQHVMEDFSHAIDDMVFFDGSMLSKITHWRRLHRLWGLFDPLDELVRPLIATARARNSANTYVDSLVHLRVPSNVNGNGDAGAKRALGDNEILGLVGEFLSASTGIIVSCIELTLANLVIQPEVQMKLHREIDEADEAGILEEAMPYLHAVVLESLRMHPPSPFPLRGVHDAVTGKLRKRIVFVLRDMGRHGSAWTEPDQFKPERFLPGGEAEGVGHLPGRKEIRMMPFGGGRRFCPGAGLAILQAKLFVAALVRNFELAPTSCGVDLTEVGAFINLMKKPLRVRLIPRLQQGK